MGVIESKRSEIYTKARGARVHTLANRYQTNDEAGPTQVASARGSGAEQAVKGTKAQGPGLLHLRSWRRGQ